MKSCEGIPCGRHGQCIPLVNDSYTCVCLPGYEGVNCRRRTNQLDEKTTQLPTESSSLSQENRTVNIAIEIHQLFLQNSTGSTSLSQETINSPETIPIHSQETIYLLTFLLLLYFLFCCYLIHNN